jgi:hypothetical protein
LFGGVVTVLLIFGGGGFFLVIPANLEIWQGVPTANRRLPLLGLRRRCRYFQGIGDVPQASPVCIDSDSPILAGGLPSGGIEGLWIASQSQHLRVVYVYLVYVNVRHLPFRRTRIRNLLSSEVERINTECFLYTAEDGTKWSCIMESGLGTEWQFSYEHGMFMFNMYLLLLQRRTSTGIPQESICQSIPALTVSLRWYIGCRSPCTNSFYIFFNTCGTACGRR